MKRALFGLPIAFLATGCVHAASMDQVHAGMDRSQVTAMIGPPDTTNNTAGRECAYYTPHQGLLEPRALEHDRPLLCLLHRRQGRHVRQGRPDVGLKGRRDFP